MERVRCSKCFTLHRIVHAIVLMNINSQKRAMLNRLIRKSLKLPINSVNKSKTKRNGSGNSDLILLSVAHVTLYIVAIWYNLR